MPTVIHAQHRASSRRFFMAFLAYACVAMWLANLALAVPSAHGAQKGSGYYGTPLRFDPPPVDLRGSTMAPEDQYIAPPPPPAGKQKQRQERPPAKRRARGQEPAPPALSVPQAPESGQVFEEEAPASPSDAPPQGQERESANQAPKPPKAKSIRLFGTVEFRCLVRDLPKWERVYRAEKKAPSFVSGGLKCQKSQAQDRWLALRAKLQNKSLMEKAKGVNSFFNQWPYKTDSLLWGLEDYWATPCEFIAKSGDCEDYAIIKYYALRDLGVPAHLMRIAAIKNSISGAGHAVLVVFAENDAYVLDNVTNLVLSHKRLSHYRLRYTVNEEYLWRHVKPISEAKR